MEYASVATSDVNPPNLYNEPLNSKKSREWINATKEEIQSLKKNETWELVDPLKIKAPLKISGFLK